MEESKQNIRLEEYEWDNTWIEKTSNKDSLRVLYIGDSISCPTRKLATEESEEKILFDGVATSKAVDNPYLFETVKLFASQQSRRDIVVFNSGLHGPHLTNEEYSFHYESVIKLLLNEFKETPLILLLSTPQAKVDRDMRVVERNQEVIKLGGKYNLPVIDFYSIIKPYPELLNDDGIHLTHDGYVILAKKLASEATKLLNL